MKDSPINTIIEKIESVRAPDHYHWLDIVEQPNQTAKDNAIFYCTVLFERYNCIPTDIAATIESGIFVRYRIEGLDLMIEFCNNGETGVLVNDWERKCILDSFELGKEDFNRYSKVDGLFEYIQGGI